MPFYCGKLSASICVVLGPENPQRIPANTPPVFSSLRPRIYQQLLCLATKDYSDRLLALLHVDVDGMVGRDKIVVLCGAFHGDLVRPLAQALKLPFKTLLILIVHVSMDMRSLGALGQVVLQLKAIADLVPVLGRRNHNLRPVLYRWFIWFILCEYWCSGERAS